MPLLRQRALCDARLLRDQLPQYGLCALQSLLSMPAAAAAAPKYSVLIVQAIAALKERSGSSVQAIVKCDHAQHRGAEHQ